MQLAEGRREGRKLRGNARLGMSGGSKCVILAVRRYATYLLSIAVGNQCPLRLGWKQRKARISWEFVVWYKPCVPAYNVG